MKSLRNHSKTSDKVVEAIGYSEVPCKTMSGHKTAASRLIE